MGWTHRHLLGLRGLEAIELRSLLARARVLRDSPEPTLAGRTIATMFFEDSTRTRVSFTIAAQRLGAQVVDLSAKSSSVSKGETLVDTALTVEAMGVDAIIVRAQQAGAGELVARAVSCSVLNAGDGKHAHPTQALADMLALGDAWQSGGFDFSNKRIGIIGDVVSSRVARSDIAGFRALGAEVVCIGPPAMVPPGIASLGCAVSCDLDAELASLDAVVMLRVQLERGAGALMASNRDYRAAYGLTAERAGGMKPTAWVLHPGPMNRGVEIDDTIADGSRSLIRKQVAAGVAVRMAALEACIAV